MSKRTTLDWGVGSIAFQTPSSPLNAGTFHAEESWDQVACTL